MGTETEAKFVPPYIAWLTFLHLLERMESEGVPPQVDRSYLRGSNTSNTQLMNALRNIGLIDDAGKVTDSMRKLAESPNERKRLVAELLTTYYSEPVQLGADGATHGQLEKSFMDNYGVTGSTLRKAVSFFLQAADFAQIQRSRHWKKPTQRRPVTTARKPRVQRQGGGNVTPPANDNKMQPPHDEGLHPSLKAMVADLKKYTDGWTEDQRTLWVNTFEQLLDYAIPLKEGDEEPE